MLKFHPFLLFYSTVSSCLISVVRASHRKYCKHYSRIAILYSTQKMTSARAVNSNIDAESDLAPL